MALVAGLAPKTVYLHIGLHKTGTTYLQNLMRANHENMAEQDVEFTVVQGEPLQIFAVWDLQGRRPRGSDDKRIGGAWPALVEAVNTSGHATALISEERLSLCSIKQLRKAVRSFPDSEVHVIVTVRDLARVLVSAWQEDVKNDKIWTWREYADAAADPAMVNRTPARAFWVRQDVVKICEAWEAAVPASRLHIVTVPQPPAPSRLLVDRFASVVGFDPGLFTEEPFWNNELVGVAGTEVIRRINERMEGRLNQRQYDHAIKAAIVPMLAKRTEPVRFTLPEEEMGWVGERADEMIRVLRARGYPVVGDLEDLRPQRRAGRRPDDASNDELLEASLDALAMLTERYATVWWSRKPADQVSEDRQEDLGSKARAAVFKGQRKAAELADSNPAAGKLLSGALNLRDRLRRH
jgi:PAS domain-containing protein